VRRGSVSKVFSAIVVLWWIAWGVRECTVIASRCLCLCTDVQQIFLDVCNLGVLIIKIFCAWTIVILKDCLPPVPMVDVAVSYYITWCVFCVRRWNKYFLVFATFIKLYICVWTMVILAIVCSQCQSMNMFVESESEQIWRKDFSSEHFFFLNKKDALLHPFS
jgi:hypothetical protein